MKPLLRKANLFDDEYDLEMVTLHAILLKEYGEEYTTWESETLKEAIVDDFKALGELTWQRIQAIRLLYTNTSCWEEWEVFENICVANLGEPVVFSQTQPPEPEDIAITIEMMKSVGNYEFHQDVIGYIASCCLFDGLWCLPSNLFIAQDAIKDFDKHKGISRDYRSAKEAANGRSKIYEVPGNMAESQANRIILVNRSIKEYQNKINNEVRIIQSLEA